MRSAILIRRAALVPLLALAAVPGAARQDGPEIVLGADVVVLDVSVSDRAGRPVPGLAQERFAVTEDGVPQQITFFSSGEASASIALVLDTSASMKTRI